ncbi:CRTAC1 family protein [Hyphococcus flavus]|uniref:CRTAC1 family protein n=1 Tax=Hyphococcus flavus TaxID=1866326 RepID=A0AAE9ZCC9_9PROT|nr:CRTAC1 family protein [Hyphococcus flavus]WDI31831.1 CRTAC1 family protein [Hyphococcus flavus]
MQNRHSFSVAGFSLICVLSAAACNTQSEATVVRGSFSEVAMPPLTTDRASTGGVSFADIDSDGDPDIIVTNGYNVQLEEPAPQENKFYENRGGTFVAMALPGLSEIEGFGSGSAWADYDNDGDLDGFLANQRDQRNYFVKQRGGEEVSFVSMETQPLTTDGGWSYSVAAADADNDGFLDVYVSNGGLSHTGVNYLYRNENGERFVKIEDQVPAMQDQPTGGASWADYDNDGDQDLFVANRSPNNPELNRLALYRNDGDFNFTRVDADAFAEDPTLPMSVALGDVDNDGDLDVYVGNLSGLANKLYLNRGDGAFEASDAGAATREPGFTYAVSFGDLDNDGDLDIVSANWGASSHIYLNDGSGNFSRLAPEAYSASLHHSASVAIADTDLDGDLDILIGNWPNRPGAGLEENVLIENNFASGDWLKVSLEGTASNRSGVGARLELRYQQDGAEKLQIREVATHSGWRSQSDLVQHFGLGKGAEAVELTVRWPSGTVQTMPVAEWNSTLAIVEG